MYTYAYRSLISFRLFGKVDSAFVAAKSVPVTSSLTLLRPIPSLLPYTAAFFQMRNDGGEAEDEGIMA